MSADLSIKMYQKNFLFHICLLYKFCLSSPSQSECVYSDISTGDAELILSSDTFIDNVLHLCPHDTRHLRIREDKRLERHLTSQSFHSYHLPNLLSLDVKVGRLLFSYTLIHGNYSSSLNRLSLSACNLTSIPLGAFTGLSKLEQLDLSNNSLTDLPPDIFLYTPLLYVTDISNNRLQFLPKFISSTHRSSARVIHISGNPIICDCVNSWLSNQVQFDGLPICNPWPVACQPVLSSHTEGNLLQELSSNSSFHISVLASNNISIRCTINSTMRTEHFWLSPIGVIPIRSANITYSYNVQPILRPTILRMTHQTPMTVVLDIENVRGHLAGSWYCIARSDIDVAVSLPIIVQVNSSMYENYVYHLSLCYGYGTMLVLLLVGIIGGTIRYCSETHCLRRPQPSFAYGGKTFIGVIPVPAEEDDDIPDSHLNSTYDIAQGSVQYISSGQICGRCGKYPTYWFCIQCKAVHFAESIYILRENELPAVHDIACGELVEGGELKLDSKTAIANAPTTSSTAINSEAIGLLTNVPAPPTFNDNTSKPAFSHFEQGIYVRCNACLVKIKPPPISENDVQSSHESLDIIRAEICIHRRPMSTDIQLIVSDEKLAEEYRDALTDLVRSVESPDPAAFRENLEKFRNRLRRDVGHGVKILRGEFQGLRAMSAKGVANIRNQSSVAAQKMRAGLSHKVEQVKGSMRSVAELCGASSTIGQTISVVSVYVDETDQMKKGKIISNFVF